MKSIKFRGKIKDTKRAKELSLKVGDWVYGYYFHDEGLVINETETTEFSKHYIVNTPYIEEFIEIDKDTLGQYTGVKDKNGKEIYVGDIIRILGGEYEQGFYEWNETVAIKDLIYDGYNLIMTINQIGNESIEVIGNIYDNANLLAC